MADTLYIRLLGDIDIRLGEGPPLRFPSQRAELLLAYLAVTNRAHERERLATLLWDDRTQKQAMANLRSLLAQLPAAIKPFLTVSRHVIGVTEGAQIWVDTAVFAAEYQAAQADWPQPAAVDRLAAAVALYQNDFLAGVTVRDSLGLKEWSLAMQERCRQMALESYHQLTLHALNQRQYAAGIQYAQALVRLDPLRESGHRLLMRLLVRNGQHSAALAQYEQCYRLLAQELGIAPAAETKALHDKIRQAQAQPPHKVAVKLYPFIGREAELAHIAQLIDSVDCRLLTLVGAGGSGKTRLALEVAHQRRGDYLHGIFFVSLAEVATAETFIAALLDILEQPVQGKTPPQTQLLNYLRTRELLLVLDNFEQLIETGLDLVQAVLATAPDVKLLVTSRERLQLQAEWLVNLHGLAFPPTGSEPAPHLEQEYEAVRLFVDRARRRDDNFVLDETTGTAVAHICRLVEGLPLAIELAAASLHHFPVTQIAANIRQNLDTLADARKDTPPRHHSIRAAFEQSWTLLSAPEALLFPQLSLFRGGFTAAAVTEITGSPPFLLNDLVDKSLLRLRGTGRYELHPLLRQFAADKLTEREATAVYPLFGRYFARFLQQQEDLLLGPGQQQALSAIDAEIDNVRAAWQWLILQGQPAEMEQALAALHLYYDIRGWFVEGENSFRLAAEQWQTRATDAAGRALLGRLLVRQGFFNERLSALETAESQLQASLTLLQGQNLRQEEAIVYNHLGLIAYEQGAYEKAEAFYRESLALSRQIGAGKQEATTLTNLGILLGEQGAYTQAYQLLVESRGLWQKSGNQRQLAITLQALGRLAEAEGAYAEAQTYFQESLAICEQVGDQLGRAILGNSLGTIARQQNELAAARTWFQQSLERFHQIGDPWGIAVTSVRLGELALDMAEYEPAQRLFQESLAICRRVGDQRGTAVSLCQLGRATFALGKQAQARKFFNEAIQLAAGIQFWPLLLQALTGLAQLLGQTGAAAQAVSLATFARQHPAASNQTRETAVTLLAALSAQLDPEVTTAATAQGQQLEIDAILALSSGT